MRRERDFYETPHWATATLLREVPEIGGVIFEPCVGDGSIAFVLRGEPSDRIYNVYTNDIDPKRAALWHFDAAQSAEWDANVIADHFDWIITNPPYDKRYMLPIVDNAIKYARIGVAMLLRISFEEPTEQRGPWLQQHPITKRIVLPRISFTGNGKHDSVTCGWMIWSKRPLSGPPNISAYGVKI